MSKVSHGWFVINITNYYSSYSKIHCFINHLICIWTFKKKLFLEIQPFNSFQQRFFKFLYGEVLLETLSSRREAWAFNELGRYHTRPSQFNWGPGATFLYFAFFTTIPKNGPRNGPKFKKR